MDGDERICSSVHKYYWVNDLNCARTTIKTLSEIFDYKIENQLDSAGIGMHGAGGFQAQCRIVEGSLMFFGCYLKSMAINESHIVNYCYEFAKAFTEKFGSLNCKVLRPIGFNENNPPHACEELTRRGIEFSVDYIRDVLRRKE